MILFARIQQLTRMERFQVQGELLGTIPGSCSIMKQASEEYWFHHCMHIAIVNVETRKPQKSRQRMASRMVGHYCTIPS